MTPLMLTRRRDLSFVLCLLLATSAAAAQAAATQRGWLETGNGLALFKQHFNADAGRHRLLILASPT